MKHTKRTTFLMIFAIIISIGKLSCDSPSPTPSINTSPTPTPSPAQQWADWANRQEKIGLQVVDATKTKHWLQAHRDDISLPDKIGFMERHVVLKSPFTGIIITTDHTGKRRIVAREWPLPEQRPVPPGFSQETRFKDIDADTHNVLTHNESLNWLRNNGYNVSKASDGYRITRESPPLNFEVLLSNVSGKTITHLPYSSGNPTVSLIYERGKFCIAVPK